MPGPNSSAIKVFYSQIFNVTSQRRRIYIHQSQRKFNNINRTDRPAKKNTPFSSLLRYPPTTRYKRNSHSLSTKKNQRPSIQKQNKKWITKVLLFGKSSVPLQNKINKYRVVDLVALIISNTGFRGWKWAVVPETKLLVFYGIDAQPKPHRKGVKLEETAHTHGRWVSELGVPGPYQKLQCFPLTKMSTVAYWSFLVIPHCCHCWCCWHWYSR